MTIAISIAVILGAKVAGFKPGLASAWTTGKSLNENRTGTEAGRPSRLGLDAFHQEIAVALWSSKLDNIKVVEEMSITSGYFRATREMSDV